MNVRSQELLIDAAAEENRDGYVKFWPVHIVDQIDQHLFSTALAEVVNQKQNLFHRNKTVINKIPFLNLALYCKGYDQQYGLSNNENPSFLDIFCPGRNSYLPKPAGRNHNYIGIEMKSDRPYTDIFT